MKIENVQFKRFQNKKPPFQLYTAPKKLDTIWGHFYGTQSKIRFSI